MIDIAVVQGLEQVGGRTFVDELIGVFLAEVPVGLDDLKGFLSANNADGLCRCAHKMVSTAANLGAMSMADTLSKIERCARAGDLQQASSLFSTLESDFDEARAELAAYLRQPASA